MAQLKAKDYRVGDKYLWVTGGEWVLTREDWKLFDKDGEYHGNNYTHDDKFVSNLQCCEESEYCRFVRNGVIQTVRHLWIH